MNVVGLGRRAGGSTCDESPGRLRPVVNRSRCEGDRECLRVCPYDVFEVRKLDRGERAQLPFAARLKLSMYRRGQAFMPRLDACHACGLCVTACPEHALTLTARVERG